MRRILLVVLLPAAVLVPVVGATSQDRPPSIVFASDPEDDVRGPLDLARFELARGRDGRIRADVRMHDEWDAVDLRHRGGRPASICIRLWSRRDSTAEPADHLVCATATRDGGYAGRVLRERANGLPRTVAQAAVSRPTARSLRLRFTRTAIGRPASVRGSAEAVFRGERCPRLAGCADAAPGAGRTLELVLRSDGG